MNQFDFHAPRLTKINKIILICAGICFLLASVLKAVGGISLVQLLGLSASGLFHGMIFQLITYPLVETQLFQFIFNGLVVWFIGSELESQWGRFVYLRFLILTVVFVGVISALVNLLFFFGTTVYSTPIHGLSGVNFALLLAYSLLYPDRQMSMMMIFPMRARTFCWILIGIEIYLAIFNSLLSSWAHLIAMGVAFILIRFQTNPLIRVALNSPLRKKPSGTKKHLYVVKDNDQDPPKYWQ